MRIALKRNCVQIALEVRSTGAWYARKIGVAFQLMCASNVTACSDTYTACFRQVDLSISHGVRHIQAANNTAALV